MSNSDERHVLHGDASDEPAGGHGDPRRNGHDHGEEGAGHAHGKEASTWRLVVSIILNTGITAAEFAAGIWTGSLALMADAAHNLSDAASLGVTLGARLVSRRESDARRTFGYQRAEVVGAFINLIALVFIALFLLKEAVTRAFHPQPVDGTVMMIVAGIALAANLGTAALLHRGAQGSLNVRSAFLHIVADAMASVGVLVGGALVAWKGWTWIDPAVTALISVYILVHSYRMLRSTIRILMESAPPHFDYEAMVNRMEAHPDVLGVHHVHVWQLDEARTAAEAHVVIARRDLDAMEEIKRDLKTHLYREFDVEHTTLEFEFDPCTGPSARTIPHAAEEVDG